MRLELADLIDIVVGHMFETRIDGRVSIETGRLQTIDGLIVSEMGGE